MKPLLAIVALFAALTAFSQTTAGGDAMESQIRRGLLQGRDRNLLIVQPEKANEIKRGRVSYDGIFIQAIKADNKLQLINPAAPAEYGSGRDNLVANPKAGLENSSREGLKLFSIKF